MPCPALPCGALLCSSPPSISIAMHECMHACILTRTSLRLDSASAPACGAARKTWRNHSKRGRRSDSAIPAWHRDTAWQSQLRPDYYGGEGRHVYGRYSPSRCITPRSQPWMEQHRILFPHLVSSLFSSSSLVVVVVVILVVAANGGPETTAAAADSVSVPTPTQPSS
ncbi:hypothetical protein MBM_08666 [Drepanopeziza brunnea f. sp. 'multigermtubi' MB_m1]|uniref:Uncharacterized protein n=1 Tax=Marssonina brunnea f. sp. multigermtubi (strain MB_m1) TaxID=1072389 RepID=K1WX08_MARBU|nr:uncharacterized protein MBM_08666 [Drepanopeziza brunnea f. sp. 'multigermtubi' MB_m1]EKD13223.1 hypothetical protein MBM_08666 [Drepanopeziza brunnea f. sp. 'multigermtubi' MB_m1]